MNRNQIVNMLILINETVQADGDWKEKKEQIRIVADEDGYLEDLDEFLAWFDENGKEN